jgi:hypothetical protein
MTTTETNWHGSIGGYTNHGCRCDDCRAAWRDHRRLKRASLVRPAPADLPALVTSTDESVHDPRFLQALAVQRAYRHAKQTNYRADAVKAWREALRAWEAGK